MKFKVTMKNPDAVGDAISDAVRDDLNNIPHITDEEERDALQDSREEKLKKFCSQWFKYGEYLTVEIDTEAGTATVLKAT